MKYSRVLVLAGIVGSIVALSATVIALGRPGDPHKQARITTEEAVGGVRAFAPHGASLSGSGPFDGKGQLYFRVHGEAISANVDAFDGTVRTLALDGAFPDSSVVRVEPSEAVQLADAYLSRLTVRRSNGGPKATLVDHGTFKEYLVEWQSRVNGALVPDYKSVSVNPETGEVFGFTNFERSYTTPPSAQVDELTAEKAALGSLESSHTWQVRAAELRVGFDDTGDQILVWQFELTDGAGAALVEVDAITGTAIVVGRG